MAREQRTDEPYIDLRAQAYADKSFLGGTPLSTRTALYFFTGVLAMAALAMVYLYLDERLSRSLNDWRDAQRLSSVVSELNTVIEDVRVQDRRVRENRDPNRVQAHRRAIDRVIITLGTIQGMEQTAPIQDSIITIRDAFADYGTEFASTMETLTVLGQTDASGLRAQRSDAARDVRDALEQNGLRALLAEFNALDAKADAENVPNSASDRTTIAEAYTHLNDLVDKSDVEKTVKSRMQVLLQTHSSVLLAVNDARARVQLPLQTFGEILDYIGPAVRSVTDFSSHLAQTAPQTFEEEHLLVRQTIAMSSAGVILFLIISGVTLLRSITTPLRRMAAATENLARGDRFMTVPLRGNADAIGRMARALDNWLDHLAELDHMRAELDDARMRLAMDVAERIPSEKQEENQPEKDTEDADEHLDGEPAGVWKPLGSALGQESELESRDQLHDSVDQEVSLPSSLLAEPPELAERSAATKTVDAGKAILPTLSAFGNLPGDSVRDDKVSSSIGAASKQITQISEYVSAAAVDVERTESLVQSLADTTRQLAELEICVATIRDEANLIVFRSGDRTDDGSMNDDTLVYLSADREGGPKSGALDTSRFDGIREHVTRAERLVIAVKKSLSSVTNVAHEVASTASSEALEATNKLLSQSEYLQNMLDDLVNRIAPVDRETSLSSRPSGEKEL